jgi:hypothetical protein
MPLTERDQRTLKIGGIVLGVLLVGFILFNVLLGGEDELPPIPDTPSPTDVAEPDDGAVPTLAPSPVAVFTGRDPFSVPPVLSTTSPTSPGAPVSPTSPGAPVSPTSPGAPVSPVSPTSPGVPPTGPGPTAPPTQPGNGAGTNIGGDSIVLLDVFTINGVDTVQVEVNGQVYNVSEGETFANGRYRLRSASGNCATFVRGDEAFTLCVRTGKT